MEHALVAQLQEAVRRLETELETIEQERAKKRRELKDHRRALDILSGRRRKERKPRNAAVES